MRKDLVKNIKSSFLSYEKDIEKILYKLFREDPVHADELKRLLVIQAADCLDNMTSKVYKDKLAEMSVSKMVQEGYIKIVPKIEMSEHEEVKSYIMISMDNFTPNETNPEFRDCTVTFDIVCHTDYWNLGNYRLRPLKIAGYIDGFLDNAKMTGIGTLQFAGCKELLLSNDLSGYTLTYYAIHGSDDTIPAKE